MTIAPLLEDFGPATRRPAAPDESAVAFEELRLAAFEQGYSAGWDDAVAAQGQTDKRASEAFAAALEDMQFPYQEALARMIASAAPVIEAIVRQVVPRMMAESLSALVWEEVEPYLRDPGVNRVEIVVAPGRVPLLSRDLPADGPVKVMIVQDDRLDPDKIYFRAGSAERQIDFADLAERLGRAIEAFKNHSQEGKRHG